MELFGAGIIFFGLFLIDQRLIEILKAIRERNDDGNVRS